MPLFIINSGHTSFTLDNYPDSKLHGANMGPIWGRQDPGGSHVGSMNFAIWVVIQLAWRLQLKNHVSFNSLWPSDVIGHDRSWPIFVQVQVWACLAASHYLNQCWFISDQTLRKQLKWIFGQNSNFVIEENTFQNVIMQTLAILSQPYCVKYSWLMNHLL